MITYWVPGERPFDRTVVLVCLELEPERAQLGDEPRVVLVGEPFGDRLGALRPDALALHDLLLARGCQAVDVAEVAREVLGGHPADVGDVQPEEHAAERDRLRRLDRSDRVRRRDLGEAVELEQLLLGQPVELGQRADEAEVPEPAHELLADAVDVGGGLHPVDQRLEPARRAGAVRAAVHRLALGLDDLRAAERAVRRHRERLRALAVRPGRPDDLRDHVAGALDDHVVALADLLAVDVLLVVQRRARDRDAADLDGLEHRPRIERARAADADRDLVAAAWSRSSAPT